MLQAVPAELPQDAPDVIAALRAGDEQAFLALVREHHGAMLRVARSHVANDTVAEEVVQEAWLAVLNALPRFEGRSPVRVWIFRILVNCARTRRAKEARSTPMSALTFDDESGPVVPADRFLDDAHPRWAGHWAAPPEPLAEEKLATRQTVEIVRRAIDDLPASQKAVITLRDVEGWSSEEVCEALELSEGNQRVLLHRARAKVRAAVEEALR